MALRVLPAFSALLFFSAAPLLGQEPQPSASAPIIQPGAPGHNGRILSPATASTPLRAPSAADIAFMQGMVMHHSQAVAMTGLLRTRSHNLKVQALGNRISISQTDEITYMKQWLEDRGISPAMAHSHMNHMGGMKGMGAMPMMPGMLTEEQMQALAKASGPAFDRLFLSGMIQHHTGALVMVQELFNTAGAGQDSVLFDFATDVDNTQQAEINIMQGMLKEKK